MSEKYNFIKQLGQGAFGTVDLIQDSKGNKFALKTTYIHPFQEQKTEQQLLFLNKLNHPNFVKAIESYVSDQKCQIVLEYCTHGDLQKMLENSSSLPDSTLFSYFRQLIQAGLVMQEQGIIHRDLKPSNILLHAECDSYQIKIADFGQAKSYPLQQNTFLINQSFERGTANYAAPQLLANEEYSSKCDIWSLGCIFYESIFGKHPFQCSTISDTVSRINQLTKQKDFDVPDSLDSKKKMFLKLCLQYNQRQRASWRELKLSRVLEDKIDGDDWVAYMKNIIAISRKIRNQVWKKQSIFCPSKSYYQSFSYYIAKFEISALKMIINIAMGTEEFDYLCTPAKNISEHEIQSLQKQFEKQNEAISVLQRQLRQKCGKKIFLDRLPQRRNPVFAALDDSIQLSQFIVSQALNKFDSIEKVEKQYTLRALVLWGNFTKVLMFENHPNINLIIDSKLTEPLVNWVKQRLHQQK